MHIIDMGLTVTCFGQFIFSPFSFLFSREGGGGGRFQTLRMPKSVVSCLSAHSHKLSPKLVGGGRVVPWCLVSFQCRGVLLIWSKVGQGPTVLAVSVGGGRLHIFSLIYHFSFLSPSLSGRRPDID